MLLERKRWVWAGICAGFATAVAPVALAAVPMCAVAALAGRSAERGWRRPGGAAGADRADPLDRSARSASAIFLWFWTGSPLADYTAQHVAWSESTTPLAIPRVARLAAPPDVHLRRRHTRARGDRPQRDHWRCSAPRSCSGASSCSGTTAGECPLTAWVWTICVALLALTSAKTPPNPRMLIVAFPVVIVVGAALSGRSFKRAMAINIALDPGDELLHLRRHLAASLTARSGRPQR